MLKVLLVGESNPYGGDPEFALYPAPVGCSGHRLCCLILKMRRKEYLGAFDRTNLCVGEWSLREARKRAASILKERAGECRLVLLGGKVCSAFGVAFQPFTVADGIMLRLPHPSGLCRAWNEPGAYRRAREAVATFAPDVACMIGCALTQHPLEADECS